MMLFCNLILLLQYFCNYCCHISSVNYVTYGDPGYLFVPCRLGMTLYKVSLLFISNNHTSVSDKLLSIECEIKQLRNFNYSVLKLC